MSITELRKDMGRRAALLGLTLLLGAVPWMISAGEMGEDTEVRASSAMRSSARAIRVTFDYFLKSGYAANNLSDIPAVGEVSGNDTLEETQFSAPQKVVVALFDDKTTLKPGDRLIVFDDIGAIQEANSGFAKRLIMNLAVVRVLEVEKDRCEVQITRSFGVFKAGARVKLFDREMAFWKKALEPKKGPDSKIECYVVQGDPVRAQWNQADFIVLSAGKKQGVVEGAIFELRKKRDVGPMETDSSMNLLCGMAKVFFAGPDYSVAIIASNSRPITRGIQAIYKP